MIITNVYNGIQGWALCSYNSAPYKKLEVFFSANGTTQSSYSKYWYISNPDFFDNKWHYTGYTFDNGIIKVYVDGKKMSMTKNYDGAVNFIYESKNGISIGGITELTNNFFIGLIDDTKVYNAVLSTSEIKQNYIAGLNSMLSNGNISNKEYNERMAEFKNLLQLFSWQLICKI
ncbi:MAG TPA: hypothetical protein PKU93_03505, partial [Candidatus Pacearchaeota archaeon]|nr:hypothetical protein [Candidatus Pacearchaeota archaeon]